MRYSFVALFCFLCGLVANSGSLTAFGAETVAPKAVLQELHRFRQMGSVLMIAAHPDDENTQLLTYLARGPGYRTAYLSVTRGDGGQNLLGSDFGSDLGVIRTQELLAARRLDGGRQFFTRAIDFGFSKDVNEALRIWDHPVVLGDVVRIIRTFRPDIIVTRFSPKPSGTHGHHTGSAVLGVEAFKLAGDPNAYPEQLGELTPWQPKRILQNGGGGRGAPLSADSVQIDVSGIDPVMEMSFGEIANQSRAMHKSQGFGGFAGRGGGGGGPRMESFQLLDGQPMTKDFMDGIDATWSRIAGGAEINGLVDQAISNFKADNLASNIPALLAIRTKVQALSPEPLVLEKRRDLDHIIAACLGLNVQTEVANSQVVPGEKIALQHRVQSQSDLPLHWVGVRFPSTKLDGADKPREVRFAQPLSVGKAPVSQTSTETIDSKAPVSQSYWLRETPNVGTYKVAAARLIGIPENASVLPLELMFELEGQEFSVPDEPIQISHSSNTDETHQKLEIVSPASIRFVSEVRLFAPSATRSVEVELTANHKDVSGTLSLETPAGWKVTPASQEFAIAKKGESKRLEFQVTAPSMVSSATIAANAKIHGESYNRGLVTINYPHIPTQVLQPLALMKATCIDLSTRGKQVGYVSGAGDSVAEAISEMGYKVVQLNGSDLTDENLKDLDAVVIGVRALNVRDDLDEGMKALFRFAEQGGTVIVQYNRPDSIKVDAIGPYPLRLSGSRITDENAPVRFLAPEHPALNVPNKITADDFLDWVQERGIYFPGEWDKAYTPIIAANDPGESPLEGGLLVAKHGKGYFVYTGLVWFRQLPAGVPGAYRLFANLISLGK